MIRKVILTLLFSITAIQLFSQSKISMTASQFQLEGLGTGSLFSIKFDTRIFKKENGPGFSIGLGGTPLGVLGESCNAGFQLAIPLSFNYLVGKNKHLLELGAGFTPILVSGTKIYCIPEPGENINFFDEDLSSYWHLLAGYRYQPVSKKGITYRLFISPLFQNNFSPKFWGGASIGVRI